MWEDARLDAKLAGIARELIARSPIPDHPVVDAHVTAGLDKSGRPGFFAAVLLAPKPVPDLAVLSWMRQAITARLRQIDSRLPAYPIVVQGAPEVIGTTEVVPGGPEAFEYVKLDLIARRERLKPARPVGLFELTPERAVRAKPVKASAKRKPKRVHRTRATRGAKAIRGKVVAQKRRSTRR